MKLSIGVAVFSGSLGVLISAQSVAQSNPEGDSQARSGTLQEITVTARRTAERLQDVPVAITALSAEELERRDITSLIALNGAVPGLHVMPFFAPDTAVIGIRGQRNSQVQPGQDPSIGYYFAEVPTGFQFGTNFGLFDLENIQVLKGPQGTLFGRNSTGGAMLVTPRQPTDHFEAYIKGGARLFATDGAGYTLQGVVNIPIDDKLAIRLGIDSIDQAGWQSNIADPAVVHSAQFLDIPGGAANRERLGSDESQTWRASVRFTPTDSISSTLVYQGSRYRSNGLAAKLVAINPAYPFAGTLDAIPAADRVAAMRALLDPVLESLSDDFWSVQTCCKRWIDVDLHSAYNITSWEFDTLTLKNIAGYRHLERTMSRESTGTPYQFANSHYDPQRGYEISEELQIQGKTLHDRLTWVTGLFYFHNKYREEIDLSIVGALPGRSEAAYANIPADRRGFAETTTTAIYGQTTYEFAAVEGLSLTGGLRYTQDEREMRKTQFGTDLTVCQLRDADGALLPNDACVLKGDKAFDELTYTATIDYKLDLVTLLYANHSRGYRAGGFNVGEALQSNWDRGYDPEYVKNYELGVKRDWELGGMPVRTNAAAYLQKFTNVVRRATDPNQPQFTLLLNATSADIKGMEFELAAQPFQGLEIGATYAYTNAEYTAPFFVQRRDISSNEFAGIPEYTYSINLAYSLPVPSFYGAVQVSGDYYRKARVFYDDNDQGPAFGPLNAQSVAPHGLLNLRLDWTGIMGSRVDVSLWAKNVTNEKYFTDGVPIYASLGTWAAYAGPPRLIGLEARYSYGG